MILDQENLRNSTQNCIIENFPYLLEVIFCMGTCVPRSIYSYRKVGLKCTGPREWVEVGGARANTSKYIRMVKHSIEAERKTSETSVKNISLKC